MTVSTLLCYLESNPTCWDAPLYLISESSEGYAKSSIRGVEFDEHDLDLNFIVEDLAHSTILLNEIKAILEAPRHQGHPIYSRRILAPSVKVNGEAFTHIDNPIEGVSQSDTGSVGLFEKFEGRWQQRE